MGARWTEDILMRVTEAEFRIKYDGPDRDYHDMDAALLAQALMGFSEMGRTAYRIVNPEETHNLHVNVKALEPGSFDIALEAVVPALEHLVGQMVGIFNRPDATAAANGLGISGGIAGAIGLAYRLVKWIGGRQHDVREEDDQTTITTADGDSTTVPTVVYNIAGNATFINAASQTLAPLDGEHYTDMVISDGEGKTVERINEDDAGYFNATPDIQEYDVTETVEASVETIQVGDNGKMWSFRSGSRRFNAKMKDLDFAEKVRKREVIIGDDTVLVIDRREVRVITPGGTARTRFSVEKVHRVSNPGDDPTIF